MYPSRAARMMARYRSCRRTRLYTEGALVDPRLTAETKQLERLRPSALAINKIHHTIMYAQDHTLSDVLYQTRSANFTQLQTLAESKR